MVWLGLAIFVAYAVGRSLDRRQMRERQAYYPDRTLDTFNLLAGRFVLVCLVIVLLAYL